MFKFLLNLSSIDPIYTVWSSNIAFLLNLCELDFNYLNLKGIRFADTNLSGANFIGTDLENSQMDNVNLTGANFSDANLKYSNWKGTVTTELGILVGNRSPVISIAFSPNGFILASGTVLFEKIF